MKKTMMYIIPIYLVYVFGYFYVTMPPLNWHAPEFWQFLLFTLGPVVGIILLTSLAHQGIHAFSRLQDKFTNQQMHDATQSGKNWSALSKICAGLLVFMFVFPFVSSLLTSKVFHAKEYANRIQIKDVKFSEIPEVDFTKTPIIDRDSSIRLGDKVMGNMSEWVSQFNVSTEYTQISYKDSVYRVTPLTYNGVIKYFKNKKNGIPAYIMVDSTSGETKLVKLKDLGLAGMKYVPSAMFNENLMRHLRFQYPFEIFSSPSFEIDENGKPWYICSTYTYKGVGTKKSVTGAIFLDPITGKSNKYSMGKIPTWADRIIPESIVIDEVDEHGSLQGGYLNSVFGQNGVTLTSEGYNYLEKDGDIWLYTGITSANADESNLGFVLVNLRTHEAMKIATAGANEVSAMKSAQSEVKNYGYESTFPLLINVHGNPVYLMSLKDNGLIKMYATVSAVDYQKVATVSSDEGLDALLKKTLEVLGTSTDDISPENLKEATIVVKAVEKVNFEGGTLYYIKDSKNDIYKVPFQTKYENELIFLEAKDELHVTYMDHGDLRLIKEIKE